MKTATERNGILGILKSTLKWMDENLEHIDPMPWHQAVLLALALVALFIFASLPGL